MIPPTRRAQILAWACYDFAVTVFAMNVTSRYFALWLTDVRGGADWMYSAVFAVSTALVALLMPAIGLWSDRVGRRLPFLRAATVLCVAGTAVIGWSPSIAWGLLAFGVANVGCQLGGLFYDTLLPVVSQGTRVGLASGIGVAMGYVGAAVGLLAVQPIVARHGYAAAFLPSAILIGLAALPSVWLVREAHGALPEVPRVKTALQSVRALLWGPQRLPGLWRLFVGSFFAINAINTVTLFMAVYARRTLGMDDAAIDRLLLLSTAFAMVGAFVVGWVADRWGPRRCLLGILLLWCVVVAAAAMIQQVAWFWLLGPLVGVCLGGTWTSSRAWLVVLGDPTQLGLLFGVYGLVGRASSNLGPLLWGQITAAREALGASTDRIALGSMVVLLMIGVAVLWRIPERRPVVS